MSNSNNSPLLRRRILVVAAAWTAPVVVVATAAPDFAASGNQIPDIMPKVSSSATQLVRGSVAQIVYKVSNVGTAMTDGTPITLTVYKPAAVSGVTLTPVSIPAGWTLTAQDSATFTYQYVGVMVGGKSFDLVFNATVAGNAPNGVVMFRGMTLAGSGGKTNLTNNNSQMTLNVV